MSNQKALGAVMGYQDFNDINELWQDSSDPGTPATGEIYIGTGSGITRIRRYDGSGWTNLTLPINSTTGNHALGSKYISDDGAATEGMVFDASNNASFTENLSIGGFLGCAVASVTIATGAITATASYMVIDTEGAAAADSLANIYGGVAGDILICRASASVRDVTFQDGTGNLKLAGDFVTAKNSDFIVLLNIGGSEWAELSRSTN